ncbi:MAG: FHA domain-containing serine/threonine-protein kinase [Ardenticatenia bacterium]|nr:FHA domain-containing serine/threonine-protein kinase [Ardenticatenia bacterium]
MSTVLKKLANRFQIHAKLGSGGFGVVYRARDELLGREVAIKVLLSHMRTSEYIRRFEREARAMASLNHPSIVHVYDYQEDDDVGPLLIMEYLRGKTFQAYLDEHKKLPLEEVVRLLTPVAEALDYIHARHMVHRDIKPNNIFLEPPQPPKPGRVVLGDFGLVRVLNSEETQTFHFMGTPLYMAPEQILRPQDVGPASDIYALGIVAYLMLAGAPPFSGEISEILRAHQYQSPPRPPDMPIQVFRVLERALDKEPEGRYSSASAFIQALSVLVTPHRGPTTAPPVLTDALQRLRLLYRMQDPTLFERAIAYLEMLEIDGRPYEDVLPIDKSSTTIGRDDSLVDLWINHPKISRRHCRLELRPDGAFVLIDLGSTNGTFVNGQRVTFQPAVLRHGDILSLGSITMRVHIRSALEALHYQQWQRKKTIVGERLLRDLHEEYRAWGPQTLFEQAIAFFEILAPPTPPTHPSVFPVIQPVALIGRNRKKVDVWILHVEVSKVHCSLVRQEDHFAIVDKGSTNGTFVNEQPVESEPVPINHGDIVRLGQKVKLRFYRRDAFPDAADFPRVEMSTPHLPRTTWRVLEDDDADDDGPTVPFG